MTTSRTPEEWAAEMTRRCDASEATAADVFAGAMEQARREERAALLEASGRLSTWQEIPGGQWLVLLDDVTGMLKPTTDEDTHG